MENSNFTDNVVTITPSLAALRVARDEAKRNFEEISAEVEKVETGLDEQINALSQQFEEQNADLLDRQKRAHDIAAKAESDLRAAVVEMYIATGQKQVDKGLKLSVRVNRKISIGDMVTALKWAKASMPALVIEQVDEKKFSKIADTLWNEDELPDWVTVEAKPIAVIGDLA